MYSFLYLILIHDLYWTYFETRISEYVSFNVESPQKSSWKFTIPHFPPHRFFQPFSSHIERKLRGTRENNDIGEICVQIDATFRLQAQFCDDCSSPQGLLCQTEIRNVLYTGWCMILGKFVSMSRTFRIISRKLQDNFGDHNTLSSS